MRFIVFRKKPRWHNLHFWLILQRKKGNLFIKLPILLLLLFFVCLFVFIIYLSIFQTSNAMLWLLYDLANNPKVQERVYEEVLSLIGPHGDFTSESFAKLQYIKACVKESMR